MKKKNRVAFPFSSTALVEPPAPSPEQIILCSMWNYYKNHKADLIPDVREYRDSILAGLFAGRTVEEVFAPHCKPSEPEPRKKAAPGKARPSCSTARDGTSVAPSAPAQRRR